MYLPGIYLIYKIEYQFALYMCHLTGFKVLVTKGWREAEGDVISGGAPPPPDLPSCPDRRGRSLKREGNH